MNDKLKSFLFRNKTAVIFVVLCIGSFFASGQSMSYLLRELADRIGRNTFLVLALLIPIQAGMGLNFAIVIGAMAAQISVFIVTYMGIGGIGGFLLCVVITLPIAILFGTLTGLLFNRMKGFEMIGGIILKFFSDGLYQLLFLFILGGVIPLHSDKLMIPGGIGVKNTIDLAGGLKYSIDDLIKVTLLDAFTWFALAVILFSLIKLIVKYRKDIKGKEARGLLIRIGIFAISLGLTYIPSVESLFLSVNIPIVTYLVIGLLCLFNKGFMKTVLGQNMRTVGQSMAVAKASGINVNKNRVIAIIFSTVLAGWGQLILLQNLGTLSTYGSHMQIGEFAIAALLVGGASVQSATNKQAIVGVILFHTLFILSPIAGKNLFHNAQIGEYFRLFVSYGVIAVSLALHAWKSTSQKKGINRRRA